MSDSTKNQDDFTLVELAVIDAQHGSDEHFDEDWFTDRRSGSVPPSHFKSVPPIGDADVDQWLK